MSKAPTSGSIRQVTFDLDSLIGSLVAIGIAFIGLDEFNLKLGILSLKFAMPFVGVAWLLLLVRASLTGGIPRPRNIPALAFLGYVLVLAVLVFSGHTDTTTFSQSTFSQSLTPITLPFNLIMLAGFGYIGAHFVSSRQLKWAMLGLLFFQMCVFGLCVWYLLHGEFTRMSWLPNGIPRFALNSGGMTPNSMGALWLVPTMVLTFLYYFKGGSKWVFVPIVIGALGAISTESRSMMIGLAVLGVAYSVLRPRITRTIAIMVMIAVGVGLFVHYEATRIVDVSALERLQKWSVALEDFRNNVVFGSGFGTDPAPHSVWFQLMAETGLVGFTLGVLAILQALIGDATQPRLAFECTLLLFLPYLFFLSVDIPLLQWQTWVIPIAIGTAYREFSRRRTAGDIAAPSAPRVSDPAPGQ